MVTETIQNVKFYGVGEITQIGSAPVARTLELRLVLFSNFL